MVPGPMVRQGSLKGCDPLTPRCCPTTCLAINPPQGTLPPQHRAQQRLLHPKPHDRHPSQPLQDWMPPLATRVLPACAQLAE